MGRPVVCLAHPNKGRPRARVGALGWEGVDGNDTTQRKGADLLPLVGY